MPLNKVDSNNIVSMVSNLERRSDNLLGQIQGAQISALRVGTAVITTAKIGDLEITTAKIADGAITSAKISNLSAGKVTAGTVSASRIAADSIDATKLNVATLSAIAADFGTVTAGSIDGTTITGVQVRTSLGSDRIQITGSQIAFLQGDNFSVAIQHDLFFLYGAGIGFAELGASSSRALFGISGVTGNVVYGSTQVDLILFQTLGTDIFLGDTGTGDIYFSGTFQINGSTKTAIVPTKDGYNSLYCVESPEVWFFDIADSLEEIDSLFWEVTEGETKTVTNKGGQIIAFRKRIGFGTIRSEKKSRAQFLNNNKFWNNQREN